MADTCEVVALGREDVCLEPKKVITSYDSLQLGKAVESLEDAKLDLPGPAMSALIDATLTMIAQVQKNQFTELGVVLATLDVSGVGDDKKKTVQSAVGALTSAVKKKEASPAAQSLIKLTKELCK